MKKILIVLIAQGLAVSAMASTTNFTKITNNGTVAPQYQTSTTCAINGDLVKILTKGGIAQFPRPLLKQAKYTNDVPNSAVAESLANDAVRAPVISHPGPIGGGTTTYSLAIDSTQAVLSQTSGSVVIKQNNSTAAKKLLEFMVANCN